MFNKNIKKLNKIQFLYPKLLTESVLQNVKMF
jgi:hypothetical protein